MRRMAQPRFSNSGALKILRTRWVFYLIVGLAVIVINYLLLMRGSSDSVSQSWLVIASLVFLGQSTLFYFDLPQNHREKDGKLLPAFGAGTWLSLLRLLLLSALAGFLVSPRPEDRLAWAPFTLYLAFNLIDLIDGYAARHWGQVTCLGAKLDLDLDTRGMLVGSILAIRFGTAGGWYALVGLARYIYVAAAWARKRMGLRVSEQPNPNSRPLAGLQMGISTALLAPVLHPPFTILVSSVTMIIFLANFFYDWLVAIGRAPAVRRPRMPASLRGILAPALRALLFALLVYRAGSGASQDSLVVELLIGTGLLLGAGVRVLSLVLLAQLGISLSGNVPDLVELIITFSSLMLVYTGSGWLSLWAPENSLIRKRLGDGGAE